MFQACVVVDTVLPGSPASSSDVQPGDLLMAVDGKRIASIAQAAKCMKGAGDKYTLRLERKIACSSPPSNSVSVKLFNVLAFNNQLPL